MHHPIKSFRSIQERAKDTTSIIDVVVNCFFKTVKGMGGGRFPFKTKLVGRGFEMDRKYGFESMLEDFLN